MKVSFFFMIYTYHTLILGIAFIKYQTFSTQFQEMYELLQIYLNPL